MTSSRGVTYASIQGLGLPAARDLARSAKALGYSSAWTAETTGPEAFSTLAAMGAEAPGVALGTGVLALQLRTPMLAAQGAATLQALYPDRDILLGVGVSSPVVVGDWHGATYSDAPLAQTREYLATLRDALSGERIDVEGRFYWMKRSRLLVRYPPGCIRRPKIVLGALNERMLHLAGELADGVLLNYLPASAVPYCIERVREGEAAAGREPGSCQVYAYVHVGVCDPLAAAERARTDLYSYAVVDAYAKAFARAGFEAEIKSLRSARERRDRDGAVAAISPEMVAAINFCGSAAEAAAFVDGYVAAGVDHPVIMPLPWGENRWETVEATIAATAPSLARSADRSDRSQPAAAPVPIVLPVATPDTPSGSHQPMDSTEFRRAGHQMIDWIADYLDGVEDRPVRSRVEPGWVRSQLPATAPELPESFSDIVADLDRVVMPGITHWQSPRFFGFFPGNSSMPSILGDLASSGLGVQGMLWATSPAATEVETHMLDWMADLCALPGRFRSDSDGGGVILDSASSATLVALLAARRRVLGDHPATALADALVYCTEETHSSLVKDARVIGLSDDQIVRVDVDATGAMVPSDLALRLHADRAKGRLPLLVCATVGTTSTCAVDPVAAIAEVITTDMAQAQAQGVGGSQPVVPWLHVDAAYAGSAMVCPEFRVHFGGLDRADSFVFNPHKWLLTNFDCSLFWVADRRAIIDTLSITPAYLQNTASASGDVIDYRDWQVPLGRRFRALKLWFVIRSYGAEGLRDHIRRHVALARDLGERVDRTPHLVRTHPVDFGLVCIAHADGDAATQVLGRALEAANFFVTVTVSGGRSILRIAFGAPTVSHRHVDELWSVLQAAATPDE